MSVIDPRIVTRLLEQLQAYGSTPKYDLDDIVGQVFCVDAMDMFNRIPDSSIDVILTDEPYGQSFSGSTFSFPNRKDISMEFDWDGEFPLHLVIPWVFGAYRVLKDGGALINTGIPVWATTFHDICDAAGLSMRADIVWAKTNPPPRMRHGGWRGSIEMVWIASKGSLSKRMKKVQQQELLTWEWVMDCPNCQHEFIPTASRQFDDHPWQELHVRSYPHHSNRVHETQKPDWIAQKYLWLLSEENDIILDPFCGSGSFVKSAAMMGRRWIAGDMDQKWVDHTKKSLSSVQKEVF